jgi:hypothetical protein
MLCQSPAFYARLYRAATTGGLAMSILIIKDAFARHTLALILAVLVVIGFYGGLGQDRTTLCGLKDEPLEWSLQGMAWRWQHSNQEQIEICAEREADDGD